jgi:threonine/homoserine/homoserine lactone efflux protein
MQSNRTTNLREFGSANGHRGQMNEAKCTTIGISAGFWVLFVYVLQVSSVRGRLLALGPWLNRLLGAVLITLGIRLWLTEVPGLQ